MKEITLEAIKDFQVCSLFYKFRYEDAWEPSITKEKLLALRFENTMKKIVFYFFYKMQAGSIPTYSNLISKWEKLWFPKDMDLFDISASSHRVNPRENLTSYAAIAAANLLQFYEDFNSKEFIPLMVDESFSVPVGKFAKVNGSFDLVLRDSKNTNHVIKFSMTAMKPIKSQLIFDFALLKYAFEHRGYNSNTTYSIYDIASSTPGRTTVLPTTNDVDGLKFWVNLVNDTDIHYPRRGLCVYCRGCPFDQSCKDYKYPTEQEVLDAARS